MDIKAIEARVRRKAGGEATIADIVTLILDDIPALIKRVEQLEAVTEKAIHALQDPLNNSAIADTIWMPDEQAMTLVDFLCRNGGE